MMEYCSSFRTRLSPLLVAAFQNMSIEAVGKKGFLSNRYSCWMLVGQVTSSKVFKLQRYFSAFHRWSVLNSQVKSSFIAKPRLSVSNMSTENCTSSTWLCRSGLLGRASSKRTGRWKHPDFSPGSVCVLLLLKPIQPSHKSKRLFNIHFNVLSRLQLVWNINRSGLAFDWSRITGCILNIAEFLVKVGDWIEYVSVLANFVLWYWFRHDGSWTHLIHNGQSSFFSAQHMQLPAAQNLLVCKADLQNLAQLNKLWILNRVWTISVIYGQSWEKCCITSFEAWGDTYRPIVATWLAPLVRPATTPDRRNGSTNRGFFQPCLIACESSMTRH